LRKAGTKPEKSLISAFYGYIAVCLGGPSHKKSGKKAAQNAAIRSTSLSPETMISPEVGARGAGYFREVSCWKNG
jgi:hypothetical protein